MSTDATKARRVLIVDDDDLCARSLESMLRHLGVERVVSAANGSEVVQLLDEAPFDLILCDLNMPGCDGVETMRLLATHRVSSAVVLVSGSDTRLLRTATEMGRSRGLRMVGMLHKPFRLEQLREVLEAARSASTPRSPHPVQLAAVSELRRAIDEDELVLHFQPQLNLSTRDLEGVEALVRWIHPERGMIFPDAFIPIAERSGLIEPMTDWVMRRAIEQASEWNRGGLTIGVSINVSVRNLQHLDLPDRVEDAAQRSNVDPSLVTLEVTESGVTDDVGSLLDIAARLRLKGFPLSIDDFGTGFSSLSQLRRLPFTELKLDRSFVIGAVSDPDSHSVLESSVSLAQRLQLETVAEGIETEEEWRLLAGMGVNRGQGYFMGRPMAAENLSTWHDDWQRHTATRVA